MTHEINIPQNWPLLDDLHTFLWKAFPMDRFDFIRVIGGSRPEYAGTTMPGESDHTFPALGTQVSIFEDVEEAVREFVGETCLAA